jgi:zinc/manganese transport system substrate-binding protein
MDLDHMVLTSSDMEIKFMTRKIMYLCFLLFALPVNASTLNIFTCEPEWGALAEEIGGQKITLFTATTAFQDPHHIEARPSLLAKARNSDLLFCTGADLEAGWLPILLRKSGNDRIQPGKAGHLMAADHVQLLETREKVDRSMGDVHAAGNPHIHLDPRNLPPVADVLARRLIQIDPANKSYYEARLNDFSKRWKKAVARWEKQSAAIRGMPIVVHHRSWVYLQNWLDLEEIATLEPKPGVPPTSKHLAKVVSTLQSTPARAVIRSPYQDARTSQWLEKQTEITAILLPYTVGGTESAGDLFSLFDDTISRLGKVAN